MNTFLDANLQKNLELLPSGSIPQIGRQKLAIDRMQTSIQEAKVSLSHLKKYQETQLSEASDRLNFMQDALGNMTTGYRTSHDKRSKRRSAIHQEKKRLAKIMVELDAKRNEIEDINGMVENNEHIYENFEKLRDQQAELLKRNIPDFEKVVVGGPQDGEGGQKIRVEGVESGAKGGEGK